MSIGLTYRGVSLEELYADAARWRFVRDNWVMQYAPGGRQYINVVFDDPLDEVVDQSIAEQHDKGENR